MQSYWENLQHLLADGQPFVSVTLVDVVASAPADVGSKMLVTSDGLFHGSVGGGKIEMKAIAEARALLAAGGKNKFAEWNLQSEVGMTCGGVVRLYFETYNIAIWPIIIFGAGHCAQALVRLPSLTMRSQVTVLDTREDWLAKMPATNPADHADGPAKLRIIHAKSPAALADHVAELPRNSFVLMMTMGHATDQPILIEILKRGRGMGEKDGFKYVGVIGSEAKAGALKRGLIAAGISEEDATSGTWGGRTGKYFCPLGWPVGSNDPAEIAVSVAGHLLELRGKTP